MYRDKSNQEKTMLATMMVCVSLGNIKTVPCAAQAHDEVIFTHF